MEDEEKELFLYYLGFYTPEYRKRLLKKLRIGHKNCVRSKTKKYMLDNNISFNSCISCGDSSYIEIHHVDYNNPYLIAPLCMKCHRKQHRKNKEKVKYIDITTMEVYYG